MSNFKSTRFIMCYPEIKSAFKLCSDEWTLLSYLWNQCAVRYKNGFCGYSNTHIGEFLCLSRDQVKRLLKKLHQKNLITIENPCSPKRRIYVNEPALSAVIFGQKPDQVQKNLEAENKIKDLEEKIRLLTEENQRLRFLNHNQQQPEPETVPDCFGYVKDLLHKLPFTEDQKQAITEIVGPAYKRFAIKFGMDLLAKHKNQLIEDFRSGKIKISSIKNIIGYLLAALKIYQKRLEMPKSKKSQSDSGLNLPDWYSIIPDEEATAEDLAAVLALQDQILHRKE